MNFKNFKFKEILSKFSRSDSVHKRGLYTPHRDWMIIVIIFFILLILSIGAHSGIYFLAEKGDIFYQTAEEETFNASLRRDLIDETVREYESKELNSGNNDVILRDPSSFDE